MVTSAGSRYWPPFADLVADRRDPFVLSHGAGSLVYDVDGNEYVDATAGLWYALVGHGRKELAEAASSQMLRLAGYYTHGDYANIPALQLAERICALAPVEDPLVMLSSGGGDAVDTAAKLALRYWNIVGKPGKVLLLHRELAYHGMHGLGTGLAGLPSLREGYGEGVFPTFDPVPANDAQALEDRIVHVGAERVAAFFAEPVIGAGGVIPPAPGYLEEVQRICREQGVLFIVDEVITGFGRLGRWFGSSLYGLSPDLMCIAKGITSGYVQLGGVLASRRVWEAFADGGPETMFRHGYTYAGHPTACAVAMANLEILENEDLIARAAAMSDAFAEAVTSLGTQEAVKEVRTAGLMAGVELDTGAMGEDFPRHVARRARELGALVRVMFGGSLQISPPLVIKAEEIRRVTDILGEALNDCSADPLVGRHPRASTAPR